MSLEKIPRFKMATHPPPPTQILSSLSDTNQLITLPKPIIYQILSELNPVHLGELCKSNSQLAAICREKQFWKFKHTVGFGSPAPKPDQRIVFYVRKLTKLKEDIGNLEDQTREATINIIVSVLKNPPPKEVIIGDVMGTVDFDETQFDPGVLQLGNDINKLANYRVMSYENFEEFENRMLRIIQPATRPVRGGRPVRVRQPLISDCFKEQINPNAKLFPSNFDDDPIRDLLRAIYDNTYHYAYSLMDLEDETDEIKRVLDNLQGVKQPK